MFIFSIVLIGLFAEQDEALKVEKSFFPIKNFAPFFNFFKSIFFFICQTLFLLIVGTLSLFNIIYLYTLPLAEYLEWNFSFFFFFI